jgi:hypothetical protein
VKGPVALEAWCERVVESAFARLFPSALEPVQIARKLVAAFERDVAPRDMLERYVVCVAPSDFARLSSDRDYLESRWSAMLAGIAQREGRALPAPPSVTLESATNLTGGTVSIEARHVAVASLVLRVRRGVPPGASVDLGGTVVVGRDPACDLVLVDPRVSRRHFEVTVEAGGVRFSDLDSANGTIVNGSRSARGSLEAGDAIVVGDTELAVEGR